MQQVHIEPWRISRVSPVDDFSETVFFTGNGVLGVRGYGAWAGKKTPQAHAVFRAGLFSELKPGITDMVQLPDALTLRVPQAEPQSVTQALDMQTGTVRHTWETPDAALEMVRYVSMADSQLAVQTLTLTARRAGVYTVEAVADTTVRNLPVHDDQTIAAMELVPLLRTVSLAEGEMRLRTIAEGTPIDIGWTVASSREANRRTGLEGDAAVTALTCELQAGETWRVEKQVRVLVNGEAPHALAVDPLAAHTAALAALWRDCDIEVDAADPTLQGALRYNIYQLLCNNAAHERGVSIGARGLSHGRYKGNTFWDTDVFMLPFYLWTRPQAAKNLLYYRADRLPDARRLAAHQNLEGARFPWMCSATGLEQCESWDIGLCEVHITADVAYAMQRYVEVTGDAAFQSQTAAPLYADTARYWLSRLTYEPAKDEYTSFFVKGPDEYCGAAVNNTFTNYMARNNIRLALTGAQLTDGQRQALEHAQQRIMLLYDPARDLYLQDETLDRLEPLPFTKNGDEPSYKRFCFDRMQRYRALKQADLVLLMTLYPGDFTPAQQRAVFDCYEPITLHDSTLSYGPHALLALRLGLWDKAEDYLRKAVYLDLMDVMGNTGHEGLHMAALGAAWQAVVFGAAGLWSDGGALTLAPMLPPGIRRIKMHVYHRGKRYAVEVTPQGGNLREEA